MKKYTRAIITFIVFIVFITFIIPVVNGQNLDGQNLSVFPAIQEKLVKPGERTRIQIQFKNGADTALMGKLKVVDFVVTDKQGTPKVVESKELKSKYGASSWITLPNDSIAIPPRDYVSVDMGVEVPYDVSTCSKYALVYVEPLSETVRVKADFKKPETATTVSTRLGGIVTFNIENSNCKENLNISGFTFPKFQEYGPIKVKFDVFNLSDYHIVPAGYANISNFFGLPTDQQNIKEQRIFPEAGKSYDVDLGSKWMVGRYKILVNVASNGLKSVSRQQVAYVWMFPWRVALAVILTIIVMIIIVKNLITKETDLEEELKKEKDEIEKLKLQLRKRE